MTDEQEVRYKKLVRFVASMMSQRKPYAVIKSYLNQARVPEEIAAQAFVDAKQVLRDEKKAEPPGNRAKGCAMCILGFAFAIVGYLLSAASAWICAAAGLRSFPVAVGFLAVGIGVFLGGLFNIITGRDSTGGKGIGLD